MSNFHFKVNVCCVRTYYSPFSSGPNIHLIAAQGGFIFFNIYFFIPLIPPLIMSYLTVYPVVSMPSVNYESDCSSNWPCSSLAQDNCNSLLNEPSTSLLSSLGHPFSIWRPSWAFKMQIRQFSSLVTDLH